MCSLPAAAVDVYDNMKEYIDLYIPTDVVGVFGHLAEHPDDFRGITEMCGRMTSLLESLEATRRSGDDSLELELASRGISEIVKLLDRALAEHRIPAFKIELDGLVTKKDLATRQFEAAVDKKNMDFGSILARLQEISRLAAPAAASEDAATVSTAQSREHSPARTTSPDGLLTPPAAPGRGPLSRGLHRCRRRRRRRGAREVR